MKRRFWIWLLFFVFAYLQYRLWFSEHGLLYLWRLEQNMETQQQTNQKLEQCNQKLAEEIIYFRNSAQALEERARYELDMIKPNETFVLIEDGDSTQPGIAECESLP